MADYIKKSNQILYASSERTVHNTEIFFANRSQMNLDKLLGTAVYLQSIQAREIMYSDGLRKDLRDSEDKNVFTRQRWEREREQEGLIDKKKFEGHSYYSV